ncbi:hypothetical protein [Deinococcus sp. QL22]|uniref:hypothetical protein n=1 Tax=Deinococcus sp. QL22 TaxID=2939437 RepID=UPI0020181B1C|nr:hypothetical protein [Deinococcus sp. QL22]UQN10138.1 hypothetical protein M1R55_28540 [Deinococcus sp. QL22]
MLLHFQNVIAAALPSETTLGARLATLDARDWARVADRFSAVLPEFGAVIALPRATHLASLLSEARGVPTLHATPDAHNGHWALRGLDPTITGEAILVTEQLAEGIAELEVLLLAASQRLNVIAVVSGVERTPAGGRSRLELQEVAVWSAVQLAQTPAGWVLERRRPPAER